MKRDPQAVIEHCRLMATPALQVVAFLESRSTQRESPYDDPLDEVAELDLLSRGETLIDLAVAEFGVYKPALTTLFKRSGLHDLPSQALRYALLKNRSASSYFDHFPGVLFETFEESTAYFQQAPLEELFLLFQNRRLHESFLTDFFKGESETWKVMSDAQRLACMEGLVRNERMVTPYDDSFLDGYAEYSYNNVFQALWKMAETCPVNEAWARRLSMNFERAIALPYSLEDPRKVAERWVMDPQDQEALQQEQSKNQNGDLSGLQGVRKGLARLILKKNPGALNELVNDPDIAFRAAAYRFGNLNEDMMNQAAIREGVLFIGEALHNERLWQFKPQREALREIAWSVNKDDGDLLWVNIYRGVKERMMKQHPAWFLDDPDLENPSVPDGFKASLATPDDLNQMAVSITQVTLDHMRQIVQPLVQKTQWIFWMSVGALAVSLFKH